MAILEVYKENKLLGSFRLDEDFVSIGRAGSNEIVLPDRELKVSRYHAVLIKNPYDPPRYILRDLSSSWGTKIGKEFIFQTPLKDGDIIDIANFRLKYVATGEKTQEPFMIISDSREMEPITLPSDIGDQETHHGERNGFSQGIKDLLEGLICGLPASIRNLYEEMLGRVATAAKVEEVIDNAMPLLFYTLNMKEGCSGCFVVFEGEEKFRYLGAKGMEGRFSIPVSRQVIEEIHGGHSIAAGNQLWVPLSRGREVPLGFLYLARGPYGHPFDENEVKVASYLTRIIAGIIEHHEDIPWRRSDFIKWPRTMIGANATLREIQRIASLGSNVLLLGKTGVGKEVAAVEIHRQSERRGKAFRPVNCPGIPTNLLEATLFGHKKGAFTGAIEDRKGEFELADGGTIFLDEIADVPIELQSKLLRVIENKTVQRVGEEKTKMVDVRIIAATSHDLHRDMEGGKFRSDLYYRFGTRILIPPLNERKNDIPLLAHYFLDKYAAQKKLRWRGITAQSMHSLVSYPWPGNVRELESAIENALSRSDGVICLQHLPAEIQQPPPKGPDVKARPTEKRGPDSLEDMEKAHIMEILNYTIGNKEKAAKILKISKPALYNKMKRSGIPADFGKRD
jgi:DNA-binding NtrC family response regulator